MVTSWDDYPVHQTAEYIAHVATSDRNFYDRYYFNMFDTEGRYMAIFGYGQYPNLGVHDAFVDVRIGGQQHIVRASAPLGDRMHTRIGPLRVEVLEPLRRLRFVVEPNEHSVAMDITWTGHGPAIEEPRQYLRKLGRVVFDTQRLAQLGTWEGTMTVAGVEHRITPADHWGSRDRSWGVRPVGEKEPEGIRAGTHSMSGMWNYFPIAFEDHCIYYINNEENDGSRVLVQGERVWLDGRVEDLGPSTHELTIRSGTRIPTHATIRFPEAGIELDCQPLLTHLLSVGTGYGMDADWRHGMYQGPGEVVQGLVLEADAIAGFAQYGVVDQAARFTYDGKVGYGLFESAFIGPFERYGMTDGAMGAP